MNGFDHRILVLLKKQQERREKFRPERGFEPDLCIIIIYLNIDRLIDPHNDLHPVDLIAHLVE